MPLGWVSSVESVAFSPSSDAVPEEEDVVEKPPVPMIFSVLLRKNRR